MTTLNQSWSLIIKFKLSSGTKELVPVVTVSLRGGKKQRATMFSVLTWLWDSGDTNIMIKRWHTKPYKINMHCNRVEYSTFEGQYCTTCDAKVSLGMPEFCSINIILHHFHCQFLCSQNCETLNFFAQNMPKTIDWLESQSTRVNWLESQLTRVPDVCPSTDGKTIWLNSYSTRFPGICLSTDTETIRLES